jgi:phosphohistidine swiveling domain-containing protein
MENKTLPLNPNVELLKWGPIQARYFFISDFLLAIESDYYKGKNEPYKWPKGLLLFKGINHLWMNEFPDLWERGRNALLDIILPDDKRSALREEYDFAVRELEDFEEKIISLDLTKLAESELAEVFFEFGYKMIAFWGPGLIPEIANYGSLKYFEGELKKANFSAEESAEIIQVLTAPEELSFFQKEELELLNSSDIKKHRGKYFWIKNSYGAVFDLDEEFFKERKSSLNKNLGEEIEKFILETKKKKEDLIKKYSLGEDLVKIGSMIALCINWQDERKAVIEKYLHFKKLLLDEIAKRLNVAAEDLMNFSSTEIISFLEKKISLIEIQKRKNGFAVITNPFEIILPPRSDDFWEIYSQKVTKGLSEVKGIVASKGKSGPIRGTARIVSDPHNTKGFNEGDILVASMTSPEFIYLMRKSSAIITDEGGLTSHAAIVSRELGVPCIVGTKVATKVLHDGDYVEVDANSGIVKLIQKFKE